MHGLIINKSCNKHIIFFLYILVLVAFLCGCEPLESKFDPNDKSFTVSVPKGWELLKDNNAALFAISPINRRSDPFPQTMIVLVEIMPVNVSTKRYMAAVRESFRDEFGDIGFVEEGTTFLSGKSGRYYVFEFREEGEMIKGIAYTVVERNKAYSLIFLSTRDEYNKHYVQFDKIKDSFKIDRYQ